MTVATPSILVVNGGSSSIKFAAYEAAAALERTFAGRIERIGLPQALVTLSDSSGGKETREISAREHAAAVATLLEILGARVGWERIRAVGHRVVHGGPDYYEPQRITAAMLGELSRLSRFDPEHLPFEIALIEAFANRRPELVQIACFDTAFHRGMPRVARLLPLPRRYDAQGVQRYGFHGLSYQFVMDELVHQTGALAAQGRVILAHLGNGASLAAVRAGQGIDTTMGFTPTAGMPMSTRSGDLDPGLVDYFARTEGMTCAQFHELVNRQSGLLGISEISPDMRDLLDRQKDDVRAAEAVAHFCYQLKKWLGAYAAALGGLDILAFTGGIGENAAEVRRRACQGLEFLGIELDAARNEAHAAVISTEQSRVQVRVIHTDEERVIARAVWRVISN